MVGPSIEVRPERPDRPEVEALLETGAVQTAAVRPYGRCGYRRRIAFGGYPDNGLSLFLEKRLAP
jgi:hypothetical protein